MVKIRLMRVGKRKQPYYRVVVADARSPRDGRFIENIGRYHPRQHPSLIEIDPDRAMHWLQQGAQPSDPVRVLLQKTGIWGRFTGEGPTEAVAPPAEEAKKKPAAEPPAEAEAAAEPGGAPEAEAAPEAESGAEAAGAAEPTETSEPAAGETVQPEGAADEGSDEAGATPAEGGSEAPEEEKGG